MKLLKRFIFCISSLLFSVYGHAQDATINGTVLDDKGMSIPGATIVLKGTTSSVATDFDGKFQIKAPKDGTLTISFIGYKTVQEAINGRNRIDVKLHSSTEDLHEVVVVGYGTQKKRDITGAISSISSKDLTIQSATNVQNLFQGRLSGVSVSTSGVPGASATVRVRGIGTLGNNNPLYVIDGFPTKSDLASQINPSDIESIQVLKDAASASIYGAQAANGVILITTKQGKKGKTGFDFKFNSGVQIASNLPKMLNSEQYGEVLWNAMKNAGLNPSHAQYGNGSNSVIPDYILPSGASEGQVDLSTYNTAENQYMRANKVGTNWANEVYRQAPTHNLEISARGGSEDSKYYVSANYSSQNAMLKWAGYDRLSLRGNSQFSISKNVTFGENLSVGYSQYKGGTSDGGAMFTAPLIPVRDIMGNWAGTKANGLGDQTNPVANLYNQKDNYNRKLTFLGNIFTEINFLKDFHFKSNIGANYEGTNAKSFSPLTYWNKGDKNTLVNSLSVTGINNLEWVWNNTLTYSKKIASNHSINILLGSEAHEFRGEYLNASRSNFAVEDPDYRYLDAGESSKNNSESGLEYSLFSLFSRVNYQYKEKLYLTAIIRKDGSSRFGNNNKYGYFPGVSGAYRISEESFMSNQHIFNELKLRASYGKTGNQDIGNYGFASTYVTDVSDGSYPIDGNANSVVTGIRLNAIGNENIKWETTDQTNFGIDAGLLNNRLTIALDVYHKVTSGILQQVPYPSSAGVASPPYENIGKMQNNGFEFSANFKNSSENKDFSYDLGFNLFAYKNKVTKLASNKFISSTYTRTEEGHPISSFYGYKIDGIFQNQAEVDNHATQSDKAVGRWIFNDVNNDGVINDKDRTYIGSPIPDFEYSFNNRFKYKNFDLTLFVQGTYGNKTLLASKGGQTGTDFWGDYSNKSTRILDTWTPNNRNASLPEINILNPNGELNKVTSYLVEDGSYLRLKLLEFGYTLPETFLSKIGASKCRVYANAQNLLTLTKYNGMDPEVNRSNDLESGVDNISRYPLPKVFSMGLSLSF